jgi:hypothetical protein
MTMAERDGQLPNFFIQSWAKKMGKREESWAI